MGFAWRNTFLLEVKMNTTSYAYTVSYIKAINIDKQKDKEKLFEQEKEIYKIFPDKKLLNVIFYKNDFHNLKVIMKNRDKKFIEFESLLIYPCVYNPSEIYEHIRKNKITLLPKGLNLAAKKALIPFSEEKLQLAEFIIDKEAMDFSFNEAQRQNNKFLTDLILLENTLANIKISLRCAKYKNTPQEALAENSYLNKNTLVNLSLQSESEIMKYISSRGYTFEDFDLFYKNKMEKFFLKYKYVFLGIEPVIYSIYKIEYSLNDRP